MRPNPALLPFCPGKTLFCLDYDENPDIGIDIMVCQAKKARIIAEIFLPLGPSFLPPIKVTARNIYALK